LRCGALGCAPVLHLKIVEQILVAQKIGKADCVTDLLEDLRQIDRLRARAAASIDTPVSRPALPRVEDDRRVDDVLRALIELGGKAPYQGRNGIR